MDTEGNRSNGHGVNREYAYTLDLLWDEGCKMRLHFYYKTLGAPDPKNHTVASTRKEDEVQAMKDNASTKNKDCDIVHQETTTDIDNTTNLSECHICNSLLNNI